MKQTHPGFSFIEVLISLVLGSLLMITVTTVMRSLTKSAATIRRLTQDTPLLRVHDMIRADIGGIFLPRIQQPVANQSDEHSPDEQQKKEVVDNSAVTQKGTPAFTLSKDGHRCSFLTTHALTWSDEQKARCVRVTYTLQKSDKQYQLTRTEQPFIVHNKKGRQEIVLFDDLSACTISCYASEKKDKKDKKSSPQELTSWDKESETPGLVRIKLERDNTKHDWWISIPALHTTQFSQFIQSLLPQKDDTQKNPRRSDRPSGGPSGTIPGAKPNDVLNGEQTGGTQPNGSAKITIIAGGNP